VVGKVIGVGVWLIAELPGAGAMFGGGITVSGRLIVDVEVVDTTMWEGLVVVDGVVVANGVVVVADGVVVVADGVVVVVDGVVVVVDGAVVVDRVVCCGEKALVEVVEVDGAVECDGEVEIVVAVVLEWEVVAAEFKSA